MNRDDRGWSRRRWLAGLALAPLALTSRSASARAERALSFHHTHTGEQLRVTYFAAGQYLAESLAQLDRLLRDFRTGDATAMDRALFDQLHALSQACGGGTYEIISGYRSPATNTRLRQAGGGGVARNSLHLQGRAIDVRLSGHDTAQLRRAAVAMGRGGVGYYPRSDFVHLDTGRPRTWG
ncbi:MAG: YcbK family protein [Pseudomonadota bacterium]